MFIKSVFFFGQNYLKKLFSDLQKNMPKISKYILGVQCIVTKVNDSLFFKTALRERCKQKNKKLK